MKFWVFDLDYTLYTNFKSYNHFHYNHKLITCLRELNGKKILFSNGANIHCNRLIQRMGLFPIFFPYIFSRDAVGFLKPNKKAYKFIQNRIRPKQNDSIIFFDDQLINLKIAKKFGWKTVHIHPSYNSIEQIYIDYWFKNVYKALDFFIKK